MKIYLSGYISTKHLIDIGRIKYGLNTFLEMYKRKDLNELLPKVKDMFLDSGGFSIRIRGIQLSVRDYVNYIKKYGHMYSAIANMDTADVKETLENHKILEGETGQKILPIYHQSDFLEGNIKMLEDYCKNYDYIALGGMAGVKGGKKLQEIFLRKSFEIAKQTKTKIHGFGITSQEFLWSLPFYSVDSTSRTACNRYMLTYTFRNGKIEGMLAKTGRKQLGIDIAKLSQKERLEMSLDARLKFNDYIDKLHQVKGMEYWEK